MRCLDHTQVNVQCDNKDATAKKENSHFARHSHRLYKLIRPNCCTSAGTSEDGTD